MLQKLKQKLHYKVLNITALIVFILSSFLFVFPQISKASNIPIANITIKTDTITKTASGPALNNLVRVGKNEPITFTVRLTLLSPVEGITLNTDKVDYDLGPNEPFPIIEFGAGVDKVNGNTCKESFVTSANIQGFIPFVGSENKKYMKCSFPGGKSTLTGKIEANKAYDLTFTASASSLGLDNTQLGTKQSFVVYPYIRMGLWGLDSNSVFEDISKEIYVEFFNTPAEAQSAIDQNKPAPTGVPGYGSNTGSGKTENTGSGLLGLLNTIIQAILGLIQEFIYAVFFWLIAPLIQSMLSVHPYTDTFVAVIYPGWEVIRNLCNIFFILALIIIAMATLFRVDSYKFKDLIIQLIIAALLVNFSLVIAQVILGLADTVQAQFLPANVTVIRSLAADLMVTNYRSAVFQSSFASQGTFSATVQPLFYLALSLGSFAVFTAIAVFLVIRIVMLWILLMVSPIAYAVGVLPATAKYRGMWWDNFLKYAFFTPIMAFFLNMAAVISNTTRNNPVLQSIDGLATASSTSSEVAMFVMKVGSNLLLLMFLFVAVKVAEQAGIYGASGVTEIAKKGMLAPFGAVGALGEKGVGYLNRRKRELTSGWGPGKDDTHSKNPWYKKAAFAVLNADVVADAFKKDAEKKAHTAEHIAEAAALDFKRQVPFFKEKNLPSEYLHAQLHAVDDRMKEVEFNGDEPLTVQTALAAAKLARNGDEKNSREFLRHLFQLTEKSKGLNATMEAYSLDKELNPEGINYEYTPEGINAFLADLANKGVYSKALAGDVRQRLSKIGYSTDQTVLYEGINHHHGEVDPVLFETERKDVDGKLRWVIKGKDLYDRALQEIDKATEEALKSDKVVIAEFEKLITKPDGTKITDEDELRIIKEDFREKVFKNKQKEIFHKYESSKVGHEGHEFENYLNWENSMAQKKSNLKKEKNANNVFTQTHWNSIASVVDGGYELQQATLTQLQSIDQGTFFGLGRGQVQEKVLDAVRKSMRDRTRLEKTRIEHLKKEDQENGRELRSETEYKKEAMEFRVLLESATYAKKLGMGPAITRASKQMKEEFSEDNLRKSFSGMGLKDAELEAKVLEVRRQMFNEEDLKAGKTGADLKFNDNYDWLNPSSKK